MKILVPLAVVSAVAAGMLSDSAVAASENDPRMDDTIIVRFEDGADIPADIAGEKVTRVRDSRYATIEVDGQMDVDQIEAVVAAMPTVAAVDRDAVVRPFESPGQVGEFSRIGVQNAWRKSVGSSDVVVAVIDSGVDLDHPDFSCRLVPGADWVDGGAPHDESGHGTRVTGIVAARKAGGTVIDGVAGGGTRVMPLRVLDENGNGSLATVAAAIEYAVDHGADIISLSLGAPMSSEIVDLAVEYATKAGALVLAATGNEGVSRSNSPANAPGVLGVGATDDGGDLALFSTHGPTVDLVAPGVNIDSTTDGGGIGSESGTSFSTPMVAGVAALLKDLHPTWDGDRIAAELLATAEDRGAPGRDDFYGEGLVDAKAAAERPRLPSPDPFRRPVVNGEYQPVVGDFTGDAMTDVIYYAPGPALDFAYVGSSTGLERITSPTINRYYSPFTVDLDANGFDDIVWYAPGPAPDFIWYHDSGGYRSAPTEVNGKYQPLTLDLDGDGCDDILWYAPGKAGDYIWYGKSGGGYRSVPTRVNGVYDPFVGDFNNDGFDDIFWYAKGSPPDFVWYGKANGYTSYGTQVYGSYKPISGDFDGDGFGDVLFYAPGTAADYQWLFKPGGYDSVRVTINGTYDPLGGDFNGDRYDDVFLYGPGSRGDYMLLGGKNGIFG